MALAAVSLLIALIAVGGPREISDVQYSAQASALAQLPALDIAVTAQGTWLENQAGNIDLSADAGQDLAFLLAAAVRPVPLAPAGQWTSVVTPEQVIQNPAPKAVLARPPALQVVYRSDLAAYARTAAGKLPDTARLVRRRRPAVRSAARGRGRDDGHREPARAACRLAGEPRLLPARQAAVAAAGDRHRGAAPARLAVLAGRPGPGRASHSGI